MKTRSPTHCPIVYILDILGDKWSLIILRDILIDGKSHFREFLASDEKIATNILSNRLEAFIYNGLLAKHDDPKNKSASIYVPTQKALDLLPALIEIMRWGAQYNPGTDAAWPLLTKLQTDAEGLQQDIRQKFAE